MEIIKSDITIIPTLRLLLSLCGTSSKENDDISDYLIKNKEHDIFADHRNTHI